MKRLLFAFAVALFSIAGMAQVEDGIYRQFQYKQGDGPVEDYPFQVFKIVNGENVWQLEIINANPYTYLVRPLALGNVVDHSADTFTTEWLCDVPYHKTLKLGEKVTEYWSKAVNIDNRITELAKVLQRPDAKKGLYGSWKLENSQGEIYKVYGKDYLVHFFVGRGEDGSMDGFQGWVRTVSRPSKTASIENGDRCDIKFTDKNHLELTYYVNGQPMTEKWTRTSIPQEIKLLFKKK